MSDDPPAQNDMLLLRLETITPVDRRCTGVGQKGGSETINDKTNRKGMESQTPEICGRDIDIITDKDYTSLLFYTPTLRLSSLGTLYGRDSWRKDL